MSFTVNLKGGKQFVAKTRIAGEPPLYGHLPNNDEGRKKLVEWVLSRFIDDVRAKIPETQRLKTNEKWYAGFHWNDPLANRENAVVNLCFATVETAHPVLVETKPRPEVMLRRQYGDAGMADALNDFAQWLMDTSEYDLARYLNEREKLKHGWCVYLLQTDADGVCRPLIVPIWNFYPDCSATNEDEMERYTIATPVATDFLIEKFADREARPWLFDDDGTCKIRPDNIVGSGYDVLEKPYLTANAHTGTVFFEPDDIVGAVSRFESDPDTGATTSLVRIDGAERRTRGRTTMLIQMFVRDRSTMHEDWLGEVGEQTGENGTWNFAPSVAPYRRTIPCCESGWRVVQITADGTFLDSSPLDPCYLGRNIEIGRDYAQVGRFYAFGELDQIIPINRKINKRKTVLDRALEFEAVPILLVDEGSGEEIDNRAVEPGDVLRKQRGSEIRWLDFRGVGAQQFEMLAMEKLDADHVSGINDVSEGRKPAGIEAASALRGLQAAAERRIRGKETPTFIEHARILKKMMVATGRKAKAPIWYRASNGELKPMDPEWLCREYDIRFAEGSGTVVGREAQEEKIMGLAQAGMIDPQTALERLNIKGIDEIMGRLQKQASAAGSQVPPANAAQLITAIAALVKADPSGVAYNQIQQALADAGIKPQPMDASQQHLEVAKHAEAEKNAAPDPPPVIAAGPKGNGKA